VTLAVPESSRLELVSDGFRVASAPIDCPVNAYGRADPSGGDKMLWVHLK
jgi:hypothetical protein